MRDCDRAYFGMYEPVKKRHDNTSSAAEKCKDCKKTVTRDSGSLHFTRQTAKRLTYNAYRVRKRKDIYLSAAAQSKIGQSF